MIKLIALAIILHLRMSETSKEQGRELSPAALVICLKGMDTAVPICAGRNDTAGLIDARLSE